MVRVSLEERLSPTRVWNTSPWGFDAVAGKAFRGRRLHFRAREQSSQQGVCRVPFSERGFRV